MRGFLIAALLAFLVASATALQTNPIKLLLQEKAVLTKTSTTGEDVHPILRAHGQGVTDGQETAVLNFIDQAYQTFGDDLYSNAVYIQQKVEDAISGRWNVELLGNNPSWGRATYINNDQWFLEYNSKSNWYYILWVPDC